MVKRLQFPNHRGELFIVFLSYWLPLAILFTLYSYMYHNKYLLVPNKMSTWPPSQPASHFTWMFVYQYFCRSAIDFIVTPLVWL